MAEVLNKKIPLPYIGSVDGYATYGSLPVAPPPPENVWELSMRPATQEGVNALLEFALARKEDFEVLKIKERMTDKLKDPRCSKIELYFIKDTPLESSTMIKKWTRILHEEIPEEDRKRWLPARSCELAPENMTTFHPDPEDHEHSLEEGCLFAFSQGGQYSSRPLLKKIATQMNRSTESALATEYDGENYYKYRNTLSPVLDLDMYQRYMDMVHRARDTTGIFRELLFVYSTSIGDALRILTSNKDSVAIRHFKYGPCLGRDVHFVMKPKFWRRYESDYDDIWMTYADSEMVMKRQAASYTFRPMYRSAPKDRKVHGWDKIYLKIDSPVELLDVDAVILPSAILEEAKKDVDMLNILETVQDATVLGNSFNPFKEKLYFVRNSLDAQKVYMERLLYHGCFH